MSNNRNNEKSIVTQPYDITVEELIEQVEKGQIKFAKYQRGYVWSSETASVFIESLLLNIPTPIVLLAEDDDGIYVVIDGRQRIGTLCDFIHGTDPSQVFRLEGLQLLPFLNGMSFSDMQKSDQTKLLKQYIRCLVVLQGADQNMTFNIFERLNSKGISLTEQDLRNLRHKG